MDACAQKVQQMMNGAITSIYYSAFVCQFDHPLPGLGGITFRNLFTAAAARGVRVHLFMNPSQQYGNQPPGPLPVGVEIRTVHGSGEVPQPFALSFGPTYSHHHQKFLLIDDGEVMLGGVEIHPCRAGWLRLNGEPDPYFWHEVGVAVPTKPDFAQWVHAQWEGVFLPPPFPFLNADAEDATLCRLIREAVDCVHMEAQLCISSEHTANGVVRALAERVQRSWFMQDAFKFMLLVNEMQPDEHPVVSAAVAGMLTWSLGSLYHMVEKAGVPPSFFDAHVAVGKVEYADTHVKVHSNLLIADGRTLVRSSSNLTDRSLSLAPCDNELGVLVSGPIVASTQQVLWHRLFQTVPDHFITPSQAFDLFRTNAGVVRLLSSDRFCSNIHHQMRDVVFSTCHRLDPFGGKALIQWSVQSHE